MIKFKHSDPSSIFKNKKKSEVSRWIRRLKEKKFIEPEMDSVRKYVINFSDNFIIRGIIKSLGDKDILPIKPDE